MKKAYLGIVDSDSILYKVAAMNEGEEVEQAKLALDSFIYTQIKVPTECDNYIFVLSGGRSNRDEIAVTKPYKGNRKKQKLEHMKALFDYLVDEYSALIIEPYEADDVVVSIHDRYGEDSVLIGIDKDNLQSVGWHFNYDKVEFQKIDKVTADFHFAMQMITGDAGDNIGGIPKVGAKSAPKYLYEPPYMPKVFDLYMEKGLSVDYFTEQYKLLRMLKDIFYPYELFFIQLPEIVIECSDEFDAI
jgi:hypothetical protein